MNQSSILNMLSMTITDPHGYWIYGSWNSEENSGDKNLGVACIQIVFKAMGLDVIWKRGSGLSCGAQCLIFQLRRMNHQGRDEKGWPER